MTPSPTGRLDGHDLILARRFAAPPDDVWASITDPERTARWYGPWAGDPGAGNTITVTMAFEEGEPEIELAIRACEPPRRLELEYHLDLLAASRDGDPAAVRFSDYYPAQQPYYEGLESG